MRGRRVYLVAVGLIALTGCAEPMTRTKKGALIGTGAGAATGAALGQAIGRDTSSTLIGAAVGAAVGGVTGGFVGNYMDKQETAMRQELANVEGANIQRNQDTLTVNFKSDLLFAVNSAEVKAGFADELARVAKVVNQYPQTTLQVAGHTDSAGTVEHNQKLSERRAEAVKNSLVGQGVAAGRISTVGFGESKPVADNSTEAGRQLNRRVNITIRPTQQ
jgi:outer membrane protein OmpA-like peptidoglycan-associated protein